MNLHCGFQPQLWRLALSSAFPATALHLFADDALLFTHHLCWSAVIRTNPLVDSRGCLLSILFDCIGQLWNPVGCWLTAVLTSVRSFVSFNQLRYSILSSSTFQIDMQSGPLMGVTSLTYMECNKCEYDNSNLRVLSQHYYLSLASEMFSLACVQVSLGGIIISWNPISSLMLFQVDQSW